MSRSRTPLGRRLTRHATVGCAWIALAVAPGCAALLGVDDYEARRLRPNPCGPLEVPFQDDTCAVVGVSTCVDGFAPDERGGCASTLPASACGSGELATPGDDACRSVGQSCGPGADPDPMGQPGLEGAIVVWAGYAGTGSDGTAARPFRTIQAALAASSAGATIVVAPGLYAEDVVVDHPVTLRGTCANTTTIAGANAAITLAAGSDGTELQNLHVTSADVGVRVDGVDAVALRDLWVLAKGLSIALDARADTAPSASISACLIEGAGGGGIASAGYALEITDTNVRDVSGASSIEGPAAIAVRPNATVSLDDPTSAPSAPLTVRRTLVEGSRGTGVRVTGVPAEIVESVVRGTQGSFGVDVAREPLRRLAPAADGPVRLERSVVEGYQAAGIRVANAHVAIVDTTVRGTPSDADAPPSGLLLLGDRGGPASATVNTSAITDSAGAGMTSRGGTLRVTQTRIQGDVVVQQQPDAGARDAELGASLDRVRVDAGAARATLVASGVDVSTNGVLVNLPYVKDCPYEVDGPGHVERAGVVCTQYGELTDCNRDYDPNPTCAGYVPPGATASDRQTVVLGVTVRDATNGDPISGAFTQVLGSGTPSVTGADGVTAIELPSRGKVLVSIERPGYVPVISPLETRGVSILEDIELVPLDVTARALRDLFDRDLRTTEGLLSIRTDRPGLEPIMPSSLVPFVHFVGGAPTASPDPDARVHVSLAALGGIVSFADAGSGDPVTCSGDWVSVGQGFPSQPDTLDAPIYLGRMTQLDARCE